MALDDFYVKLAHRIKAFREKKKLTREFMAENLDMTVSGYSRIERGEVDLKINKLLLIKDLLNCQWSDLLDVTKSQVYYIGKDHQVDSVEISPEKLQLNYKSDYLDRYVAMLEKVNRQLEEEVERLRSMIN